MEDKITKSKHLDLVDEWFALINFTYDAKTLEVLHEEVVCTHKNVEYNRKDINKK